LSVQQEHDEKNHDARRETGESFKIDYQTLKRGLIISNAELLLEMENSSHASTFSRYSDVASLPKYAPPSHFTLP